MDMRLVRKVIGELSSIKGILSVLIQVLVISTVSGQWKLVDDFQQWEEGQWFSEASDIGWSAYSPLGLDSYFLVQDPESQENIGLSIEDGSVTGSTFVIRQLSESGVAPDSIGTLYFRCYFEGYTTQPWNIGTSDVLLTYDQETGEQLSPRYFDDFNALIRLGEANNIEHYDGRGFVTTNPLVIIEPLNWYSFWLVLENTWNYSTSPPTPTGGYTLYIKGPGIGEGNEPMLIPVGTDPQKESARMRRYPTDENDNPRAITLLMFSTQFVPYNTDLYILDDIYYSPSINLSDPLNLTQWAYLPWVNEVKDVDTGDWLGWINVWHAPHVWSYSLSCWIYMREPAADSLGAWIYLYK